MGDNVHLTVRQKAVLRGPSSVYFWAPLLQVQPAQPVHCRAPKPTASCTPYHRAQICGLTMGLLAILCTAIQRSSIYMLEPNGLQSVVWRCTCQGFQSLSATHGQEKRADWQSLSMEHHESIHKSQIEASATQHMLLAGGKRVPRSGLSTS